MSNGYWVLGIGYWVLGIGDKLNKIAKSQALYIVFYLLFSTKSRYNLILLAIAF
jgi:hypothetical protein